MTFLVFVWYPEKGNNMPFLEAREESYSSTLGDKRVLDESFPHERTLFDHAFFRKGKKPSGGGASQRTLFPLSTVDPRPLTLTALRRHEKLEKLERRQKIKEREQSLEDFLASFSPSMDNTTAEKPDKEDSSSSQEPDPPAPS